MVQDKKYGGQVCEKAAKSKSLTEVDFKKLWFEIQNFKDHFKGLLLRPSFGFDPLRLGHRPKLCPAADCHNRTIKLTNAKRK